MENLDADLLMERKITAILAADVAGYSRLVAENEEETVARLGAYRKIFDGLIQRYGGRIFNTAGDAVMAEFPSAVEAVRCAIDVQESLRTRNRDFVAERQMHFRIGVSIGDVIKRGDDLLGDGVNIAARLEGLAKPGGICVSRSVFEQVGNKVSIKFADIGPQQVKNIPTPVHAYVVGDDGVGLAFNPPAAPAGMLSRPALVSAAAALALGVGAGALWLSRSASIVAPTLPSPATAAASVYEGLMRCDPLPWTVGYIGLTKLTVKNNIAEYARPILTIDGTRRHVGDESGKGHVTASGETTLKGSWAGPGTNRIEGTYSGKILPDGAEFVGTQNHWHNGRYVEGRPCTISLRVKTP